MSTVETKPNTLPATAPAAAPRDVRVVEDQGALSFLMDTARFEHLYRIAEAMAYGSFIPEHIRVYDAGKAEVRKGTVGNCFRVVNQAMRWGFDPWAVIDETYVVRGKLGYQGKLVAAIINARSGLPGGLRMVYNAKTGDDFAIVVYACSNAGGLPPGAMKFLQAYADREEALAFAELSIMGIMAVRLSVGQGKTTNDMWKKDPQQKLFYSAATKWARRYRPEIILGVLTEDDLERMTPTPLEGPPVGRVSLRANGSSAAPVHGAIPAEGEIIEGAAVNTESALAPEKEDLAQADAINDACRDLDTKIDGARNATELNAAGADMLKARELIGEERYAMREVRYRQRFEELTQKPAPKSGMFA